MYFSLYCPSVFFFPTLFFLNIPRSLSLSLSPFARLLSSPSLLLDVSAPPAFSNLQLSTVLIPQLRSNKLLGNFQKGCSDFRIDDHARTHACIRINNLCKKEEGKGRKSVLCLGFRFRWMPPDTMIQWYNDTRQEKEVSEGVVGRRKLAGGDKGNSFYIGIWTLLWNPHTHTPPIREKERKIESEKKFETGVDGVLSRNW